MRCPTCDEVYDAGTAVCPDCRVLLEPPVEDEPGRTGTDARLGVFHPAAADRVGELLARRAVVHRLISRDDDTEVRVGADERDQLRTEFALNWNDVVGVLDEDVRAALVGTARSTSTPGWYDAPVGGHIDRDGRLIVDSGDDEVRTLGPAIAVAGVILAISGWFAVGSGTVALAGIATAVIGLLIPR